MASLHVGLWQSLCLCLYIQYSTAVVYSQMMHLKKVSGVVVIVPCCHILKPEVNDVDVCLFHIAGYYR